MGSVYYPSKSRGTKDHHIKLKPPSRSEPGKKKGILPTSLAKWMCRRNRSWKHPLYDVVMSKLGQRKAKGL